MECVSFLESIRQWNPAVIPVWNTDRQYHPQFLVADGLNLTEKKAQITELFCMLIGEIVFYFDRASLCSYFGDSYRFYQDFNTVLYRALRLHATVATGTPHFTDPPNYIKGLENEFDRQFIFGMFPPINTEDTNIYKRNFIDWVCDLLESAADRFDPDCFPLEVDKIRELLESVYQRDYLWNVRAVQNTQNLFRSPNPARFESEPKLLEHFLRSNHITLVVDLRGESEAGRSSYCTPLFSKLGIECLLVNFNEPPGGDVIAPGYVKKLIYQQDAVTRTLRGIIRTPGATLFHCASGKDRTGVMAALLQKVAGIEDEIVIADYVASGMDARRSRIEPVLHYIAKEGGIDPFLSSLGLSLEEISTLRKKISL
jgi:hypothetical protein